MDEKERKIRDGLKLIAASHGPVMLFDGTVTAVDDDNYFCDVQLDTDELIPDCRLRAVAAENQSIDVLPAIGSAVVIAKIAQDEYLLLCADQISSYRVTIGTSVLKVSADGFSLMKGTDTFKSILTDLITLITGIYAPKDIPAIEAIQLRINALFA